MKKIILGLLLLMLLGSTIVSAINISMNEMIQANTFKSVFYYNNKIVCNQPILFDRGLDQEQTDNCGHGIILAPPWKYAQSFTPTKDKLTAIRLHIFKYGNPPEPVQITVSIRDNLTNSDLTTITIDTSKISIPSDSKWVLFDFKDISIIPGNKYFIVCSGDAGNKTNAYCWFYNNEDTYTRGEAWIKPDEVSIWYTLPHYGFNPDDFCFKTYFLKQFDISFMKKNLLILF